MTLILCLASVYIYFFPIIVLYNTLMLQCLPLHSYDYTCCMMYTFYSVITLSNTLILQCLSLHGYFIHVA